MSCRPIKLGAKCGNHEKNSCTKETRIKKGYVGTKFFENTDTRYQDWKKSFTSKFYKECLGSLALFHSKILQELKFMLSFYIYKLFEHHESISV